MHDPIARRTRVLARLQAFDTWSARLLGGWMPGIVDWEAKHQVAEHLWENLQHAQAVRTRLWELRVAKPDRGLSERLDATWRALGAAPSDVAFSAGMHIVWTGAMIDAYRTLLDEAHPIQDRPTVPMLERILADKERQRAWGEATVHAWTGDGATRREVDRWIRYVGEVLHAAGGVDGRDDEHPMPEPLPGVATPLPFLHAARDDRFDLALATGVPAAEDDRMGQVLYQFANYGAEMQAAETLGSVLYEADGLPWEFYFDVGRHAYDEARHSRMGEMRLAELGHHISDFPHSVANYTWRQLMDPMRRYCTLTYVIEADSFAYKHDTYRQHVAHGDHASAQAVLFDIADETLHVRWGAKWVPELMQVHGYEGTLDALVAECRQRTAESSASPLQRAAASG